MDLMTRRRAIMGMPSGKDYTVSGNVVSVSNALAKNAKSLIVSFSPKQSGSGDPSPSNVRPISGYNDIGAVRYGKNLLNKADGVIYNNRYIAFGVTNFSDSVPNGNLYLKSGNYTFSMSGAQSTNAESISVYDSAGTRIKIVHNNKVATFTASTDGAYMIKVPIASQLFVSWDNYDIQLEIGSTATSYEPYISPVTANVHSDTTLFGGTVDLVSGVCQLNGMLETFNMDNGTTISSQLNSFAKNSTGVGTIGSYTRISFAVRTEVDQTQFNRLSNTYATPFCNYAKHYFAYNSESTHWYRNGSMYLFLPTSVVGSTGQSVYEYLSGIRSTEPLSAWVGLATPIYYQLTPSQLALLKGNNTVYSNEGSISLTYVGK